MGQKQQSTIGELTGLGTLNKKFTPTSTQMTSKNQHSTNILDHILNVNVLMFAFLAIMFFNLGRSYAEIKIKMSERKTKQRTGSGAHNMYKKNDDMDEERQQMNDENDYLRTVRAELEESR